MTSTLSYRLPLLLTTCGIAVLSSLSCGDPEPEGPGCTTDNACAAAEICSDTGACVVEERLCASSADCEEEAEFCVPRDAMGGKDVCKRVVRCNGVAEEDVSALCRFSNDLKGSEQFICDVSRPEAPTCVRSDNPGATGSPCVQSSECNKESDRCLESGSAEVSAVCGVATTCGDVILRERDMYCADVEPGTTCKESPVRGLTCQPEFDEVYTWLWIQDRTVETDACESSEPGADLMGVRVLDANDDIIGWGSAFFNTLGDSGMQENAYATAARINGNANGFERQICPDLDTPFSALSPPPLSMGCGGAVFIVFFDVNGLPIILQDTMTVEVLEHGEPCEDNNRDVYSVYLCRDAWSAEQGINTGCNVPLGGTQRGFGRVSVAIPR